MTSKRELERRVDGLEGMPEGTIAVTINRERILSRERAEREGFEILGPADTPGDEEDVRVPYESPTTRLM